MSRKTKRRRRRNHRHRLRLKLLNPKMLLRTQLSKFLQLHNSMNSNNNNSSQIYKLLVTRLQVLLCSQLKGTKMLLLLQCKHKPILTNKLMLISQ